MYIIFMIFFFKVGFSDRVIDTNTGPVQGAFSLAEDVEAFLGIPYAEPPIGELRFAKPVPKRKWHDVYIAAKLPPPCVQSGIFPYYFMPNITDMSEDCLYLNIWMPTPQSIYNLRPVVIFLHPGGFVTGSSNQKVYDGSKFASSGGIVVVSINYRLGALGFLLTHTKEAPGSMGMYDQVMAMKWVKKNAKQFGGDPENIVLMGASAGAMSISAHLVSPLSKNLFRKAIIQSGSLLVPFFADNTLLYKNSQAVASLVGCTNKSMSLISDPQTVLTCLKSKPKEAFAEAEKELLTANPAIFYPRLNDNFLPKRIGDLLREGNFRKDVDLLIGINEDEGSVMLIVAFHDYLGDYGRNYEILNKRRAIALGTGAAIMSHHPKPSKVVRFYSGQVKNHTTIGYTRMLANMLGDFTVSCETVFLADFFSLKENAVYFYKFGFRSPSTPLAEWVAATHLDELQYVFGNPYHKNFTSEELELSQRLIDRWSAFARTGNPNIPGQVPWLQYSYNNPVYMNFGQEEESVRLGPNKRCEFWRKYFNCDFDPELIEYLTNSGTHAAETHSLQNFNILSFIIFVYMTFIVKFS